MARSARSRSKSTRTAPLPLAAALRALTEDLGIAGRLQDEEVFTRWEELVGTQVARAAEPRRLEAGILTVHVAGASWRTELTLRRREIIRRINDGLRRATVTDIRFR